MLNTLSNACHMMSSHLVYGRDTMANVVNSGLSYVPASVQTVGGTALNGVALVYQGCGALQDVKELWDIDNQQGLMVINEANLKAQCVIGLRLASRVLAIAGIGTTLLVGASPLALAATSIGLIASSLLKTPVARRVGRKRESVELCQVTDRAHPLDLAADSGTMSFGLPTTTSREQSARTGSSASNTGNSVWTRGVTYLSNVGCYGSMALTVTSLARVVLGV